MKNSILSSKSLRSCKIVCFWATDREAFDMFACNGFFSIMSLKEEERHLLLEKYLLQFQNNARLARKISLGNLDALRDWGYAPEYVEAMWLMYKMIVLKIILLQMNNIPLEFIEESFNYFGETIEWTGSGIDEKGILQSSGKEVIEINKKYFRPTEVETLLGDPSLAEKDLGWKLQTEFKDLVRIM